MTEPEPTSAYTPYTSTYPDVTLLTPSPTRIKWVKYLEGERRRTIARLRDLDRILGREQTIPERRR